jgi:hypothetical protein
MFNKATFGLALMLATASGSALAATKTHNATPSHEVNYTVYNPAGAFVGSDPNINVRFESNRDWE